MWGYNRLLNPDDFRLLGVENRKQWEILMALRTLYEIGEDAEVLGVGAANEDTIYHLSKRVKRVFATDLYLNMGVWGGLAGPEFLRDPGACAPVGVAYDARRIIPMHMDMTDLRFPDDTFDGVFSSGSIEHVGVEGTADWGAIAQAAREIGRVLKPGGIMSLSTEWLVRGEGWGWGHVRLFDAQRLMDYIVAPSGCDLIDTPDWEYHGDLSEYGSLAAIVGGASQHHVGLLEHDGFLFTSVHVALRKPLR